MLAHFSHAYLRLFPSAESGSELPLADNPTPATYTPLMPTTNEHAAVCDLYDIYRLARLNAIYYGRRLRTLQRWSKAVQIAIAIASSATVAAALKDGGHRSILYAFALTTAVIGVTAPIFALPKAIERITSLWARYQSLFYTLDHAVRDLQITEHFSPEQKTLLREARERIAALNDEDDPYPNGKVLDQCKAIVDREIPVAKLWVPAGDPCANPSAAVVAEPQTAHAV